MLKKLKIRITKAQYLKLLAYTSGFDEDMKKMEPNAWHTNIMVMAGINEALFKGTYSWGMLPHGVPRTLNLANLEWLVLAQELVHYCPERELQELLVQLDDALLNTPGWGYSLDKYKRESSQKTAYADVNFHLSHIQP